MNLYKVKITHAAPKGYNEAIKEYLIANNEQEVFEYLKNNSGYTYWDDIERDEDEYSDIKKIDFIFEKKGDSQLSNKWEDLFYGSTMYDWELYRENLGQLVIDVLVSTDIAKLLP